MEGDVNRVHITPVMMWRSREKDFVALDRLF